jgi:hypothetical protein
VKSDCEKNRSSSEGRALKKESVLIVGLKECNVSVEDTSQRSVLRDTASLCGVYLERSGRRREGKERRGGRVKRRSGLEIGRSVGPA